MWNFFFMTLFLSLMMNLAFAGPDLDAAAQDVCICLEAPYAQAATAMQLISQAQASGDMSQLMAAQGEMMAVIDASSECFEELPEKYPEIDQSDALQDEVMARADELCPNPMNQMQAAP